MGTEINTEVVRGSEFPSPLVSVDNPYMSQVETNLKNKKTMNDWVEVPEQEPKRSVLTA